jgi:hypothetical protein
MVSNAPIGLRRGVVAAWRKVILHDAALPGRQHEIVDRGAFADAGRVAGRLGAAALAAAGLPRLMDVLMPGF